MGAGHPLGCWAKGGLSPAHPVSGLSSTANPAAWRGLGLVRAAGAQGRREEAAGLRGLLPGLVTRGFPGARREGRSTVGGTWGRYTGRSTARARQ